jgi:outer membrane receptor protein involved in Fe transport
MADASSIQRAQLSQPLHLQSRPGQAASFALTVALFTGLFASHSACAQATFTDSGSTATLISNQVTDAKGAPIAGAQIRFATGTLLGVTDNSGRLTLNCHAPCPVSIEAPGFAPRKALWQSTNPIALQLASSRESVSVTAYRTPLGDLESPVSTRVLTSSNIQEAGGITLDGQVRLVPGVETFRRSSSLVANPSSQGLSLRGLGSTSASRTLVTEDDVPLNDAFGGWIHWEEVPDLSIRSVEIARGGASDLYGSAAIGGVVNVIPQRPTSDALELKSSFGGEGTYEDSFLAEGRRNQWGALATGGAIGTDGFIQLNPASRGTVDIASNVHAQNGLFLIDRQQGTLRLFLRGSGMNEARSNGTPLQTNGTRLMRFATGADWDLPGVNGHASQLTLRAYGSSEHYRQTFSTISAFPSCNAKFSSPRNYECLNRFAKTPDDEMGAVFHWSQPIGPHFLAIFGADTHDVRAHDDEVVIAKSGAISYQNITDRQRQTGAYAEILLTRRAWTVSSSARLDWFSNFDSFQWAPTVAVLPHLSEHVFDPRLGVSRKLGAHFALSGSGFRAYRAPTPNELYRSTQVGSLLTYPNGALSSERATGWETGMAMEQRWGTLRTSYFWTQVNHPITALTIDAQASPIKLQRENLGQIESRGISADLELQPTRWMTLQAGYQHTNATVTQYAQQSALVGNWIPQVAHNMATAQIRGYKPRIGTFSLQGKLSGRQFDDDANSYLLHGYFKLDAYVSHDFGKRLEIFSAAENLLDRQIDVGRTPLLTVGMPRVARIGFRLKLGPTAN